MIDLTRKRNELIAHLKAALALADEVGDSVTAYLIETALDPRGAAEVTRYWAGVEVAVVVAGEVAVDGGGVGWVGGDSMMTVRVVGSQGSSGAGGVLFQHADAALVIHQHF